VTEVIILRYPTLLTYLPGYTEPSSATDGLDIIPKTLKD
jgi:hypothetical protein